MSETSVVTIRDSAQRRASWRGEHAATEPPLFDADFLQRVERLRLSLRRAAPALLKGEHRARRYGRGIEFADYRPYVEGDDERDVDWRAFLRTDKLLVRRFEEEGDLPLYLFLDRSRSMGVPGRAKFDQARRLAAAIAYLGLTQHDRVSVLPFTEETSGELVSLRGREQIHRVLAHLSRMRADGRTDLGRSLATFFARPRRQGLVVVITDFLFSLENSGPKVDGGRAHALGRLSAAGQTVLAIALEEPPIFGSARGRGAANLSERVQLIDAESGETLEVELTRALERALVTETNAQRERVASFCRRCGWVHFAAQPDMPFDRVVLELFRAAQWL